ncbi:MAG: hypothetical protein Tsb0021_06370 [Chlamydiales bacterium]
MLSKSKEVRLICSSFAFERSSEEKIHQLAMKILFQLEQVCLDYFLSAEISEIKEILKDPFLKEEIKRCITYSNQTKTFSDNGEVLFQKLLQYPDGDIQDLVFLCLNRGANINHQMQDGTTALHLAAEAGSPQWISALLELGANPRLCTNSSMTPLDITLKNRHDHCTLILLKNDPSQVEDIKSILIYMVGELGNECSKVNACELIDLLRVLKAKNLYSMHLKSIWPISKIVTDQQDNIKYADLEQFIIWLIQEDILPENPIHLVTPLLWLLNRILKHQISQVRCEKYLDILIQKNILSLAVLKSGRSVIHVLLRRIRKGSFVLHADLVKKLRHLAKTLPLSKYEELFSLSKEMQVYQSLESQLAVYLSIQEHLDELRKAQYPLINFIEELKERSLCSQLKNIREYLRIKEELKMGAISGSISSFVYANILHELVLENRIEEIYQLELAFRFKEMSPEERVKKVASKLVMQFMMDKLFIPGEHVYWGMRVSFTSYAFMDVIRTLEETKLPGFLGQFWQQTKKNLETILQFYFILSVIKQDKNRFVETIFSKLETLKEEESFLIPLITSDHVVAMEVTKNKNATFGVVICNTGKGVLENHYRWKETNRYQTFDRITDIPAAALLKKELLEELIASLKEGVNGIYKHIHQKQCVGGLRIPPSDYEEHYDARQASGSCPSQVLLAWFRYRIMHDSGLNPNEGEALYKILKTHIIKHLKEKKEPYLDKTIKLHLSTISKKQEAEIALIKSAENKKTFLDTLNIIMRFLKNNQIEQVAEIVNLQNTETALSRYSILRQISNLLVAKLREESESFDFQNLKEQEQDSLSLVHAKIQNFKVVLNNIEESMNDSLKKENYTQAAEIIYRMVTATPFVQLAIQKGADIFSHENTPFQGISTFLHALNKFREINKPIVSSFTLLLESRNKKAGEFARLFWEEELMLQD